VAALGDATPQRPTFSAQDVPCRPPEVLARASAGDPRSDLYQLGAALHLMLTGWAPFAPDERNPRVSASASDTLALMKQWKGRQGPKPSRWIPALEAWEALDDLIASLLAPRPEDRPSKALQVAVSLSEAMSAVFRRRPSMDHT